jgi:hypothetical protein
MWSNARRDTQRDWETFKCARFGRFDRVFNTAWWQVHRQCPIRLDHTTTYSPIDSLNFLDLRILIIIYNKPAMEIIQLLAQLRFFRSSPVIAVFIPEKLYIEWDAVLSRLSRFVPFNLSPMFFRNTEVQLTVTVNALLLRDKLTAGRSVTDEFCLLVSLFI